MASPINAANAYASLARVLDTGGSNGTFGSLDRVRDVLGTAGGAEAGGPSFSTVLKDAIGGVMETGRKSDAQTVAMASGRADVEEVAPAVGGNDAAAYTL